MDFKGGLRNFRAGVRVFRGGWTKMTGGRGLGWGFRGGSHFRGG